MCLLALVVLGARSARAQADPDFDAVAWTPLGCAASPLTAIDTGNALNLVGDATYPAYWVGQDASHLFFRYRVDASPAGARGFVSSSNWTTLVQVPAGNAFQYQYQLTLNGDGADTLEIWANTAAQNLGFNPVFTDDAETRLASQPPGTLARFLPAPDGSAFRNTPDYFIEVAFPIALLIDHGAISSAADLGRALFWPATATAPNRHNRDFLNCPFLPATTLAVSAAATPATVGANTTTPIRTTIAVRDTGTREARGVVVRGVPAPYLSNLRVSVTADDPAVTWQVVSESPLEVRIPALPAGATVAVHLDADAAPGCDNASAPTTASASATNAAAASAATVLELHELCDGVDNDCDGLVDEGGDALCDDGNPCTTSTCDPATGCSHVPISGCAPCQTAADCPRQGCFAATCPAGLCLYDPIPDCTPCTSAAQCADDDPCTDDLCTNGACENRPRAACIPCAGPLECDDGDPCTADQCRTDGTCGWTPVPGCRPCDAAGDCDDGNPCTTDQCGPDGTCAWTPIPGCRRCTLARDCDDGNPCTADQCGADGTCASTLIPECRRCVFASECDDDNPCTDDFCTGGACAHVPIAGCCVPEPEVCRDGIDNDCDGLVDCDDPDCAGRDGCPVPPVEICGNCIDDDGDGLVDGEDPDCCEEPMTLAVTQLVVKAEAKVRGNRLRVRARYAPATPPFFDPLRQDTTVQLSDADGVLFCATIPAEHWRRVRRLAFRFTDRAGAFASGLQSGEFRILRSGNLLFTTRGRRPDLRPVAGGNVRLTVRVGRECSQTSLALRPARNGLVFP